MIKLKERIKGTYFQKNTNTNQGKDQLLIKYFVSKWASNFLHLIGFILNKAIEMLLYVSDNMFYSLLERTLCR